MKFLFATFCIFMMFSVGAQTPNDIKKIGLETGEIAPNIITLDNHGSPFLLSNRLKDGPVLVIFYSGQWCKPCGEELKDLQANYTKLKEKQVTVIAITSELPDVIDQITKSLGITFPIIHDRSHLVMDAYHTSISYNTSNTSSLPVEDSNLIHKYAGEKDYTLTFTATYLLGRGGKEGKERLVYYSDVNPDFKPNVNIDKIMVAVEEIKKVHEKFPLKKDEEVKNK